MPAADMSQKIMLGLWLSVILLGAGASEPEDITGFLGEFVSFGVFPVWGKPFEVEDEIFWMKNGTDKFAWMRLSVPCNLQVHLPSLLRRLSVSEDCRELILSNLEEEDAGIYTAKIVQGKKQPKYKTFDLKIFRHLMRSQLRVTCTPLGTRNREWRLNCSTENWVDTVDFRWVSEFKTTFNSETTITSQNLNLEVTCKADTRAESASRTVTLKEVCAGQAKNLSRLPLWALLCLGLGGSLLLSGCMELIPMEKPRKAVGGRRLAQPHVGPTQENPKPPKTEKTSMEKREALAPKE